MALWPNEASFTLATVAGNVACVDWQWTRLRVLHRSATLQRQTCVRLCRKGTGDVTLVT